jgi:sulfur carrier protein ThiS
MRISVRTAGLLGEYLPAGSQANRAELEVAEGATPLDVMAQLGFPAGAYLVSVNGTAIPTAQRAATKLRDGDDLALMPPLKGG